ncbi:MAG: peptide chain release factor 2 [Gemmataceae bacterium]
MDIELSRRVETIQERLTSLRDSLDIAGKKQKQSELSGKMEQQGFWDDPEQAQAIIQQLKPINDLVKEYSELESKVGDLETMGELADEDEAIGEELVAEVPKLEELLDAFELKAMFDSPADSGNAYVQVTAGAGGTEACDWAEMLMRMIIRWGERHEYKVELIEELRNEEAGIRNATLHVKGEYAYGYLKSETGVHRLVRISPYDSQKRRHTSFASVDVTPDIEGTIEIDIRPEDLERQVFRAGGPGGQHQNKTESAVRYIHKPTGVRGESRSERSQHKNDAIALAQLKSRLYQIEEDKRRGELEQRYDEKGEVAFGSQIRNYTMQPYTLVKDVRTGVESGQVQNVLDGAIDDFMHAYLRQEAEKAQKKKAAK